MKELKEDGWMQMKESAKEKKRKYSTKDAFIINIIIYKSYI